MIEIVEKESCTGCSACMAQCPKKAIIMTEDNEGFLYPEVDINKCVDCGLCKSVCPIIRQQAIKYPYNDNSQARFFAGQLKDIDELNNVSSGGAFWGIAQVVLEDGGVVYGAVQEGLNTIYHLRADSIVKAAKFKKSKYFQSNLRNTYSEVKSDLDKDCLVLFSGTPCQVAGLKSFLLKDYEKLVTCEVVCHGVPSKKVFQSYKNQFEKQKGKKIRKIVFRDKSIGWTKNQYKIVCDDGTMYYEESKKNLFHRGYLLGLYNRPSCGKCPFATLPRVADFTLADFWKYKGSLKKKGDIGVSLITCNNARGLNVLAHSLKYIDVEEVRKKQAIRSCRHLSKCPHESSARNEFMQNVMTHGFGFAVSKFYFREEVKYVLRRICEKLTDSQKIG